MNAETPVHPSVLTEEDFNHLYFILGAYVGSEIREARKLGAVDPLNTHAVLKARELTIKLKEKLEALQNTR